MTENKKKGLNTNSNSYIIIYLSLIHISEPTRPY